jgi:hypothetical protein
MTRVLVCGGRDYFDPVRVFAVLDKFHAEAGIDVLIDGAARGADELASNWAVTNGVQNDRYPADWEAFGSFAGPKRNKAMLDEGKPDLVIAFPGGAGTRNMIRQARKAGVEVVEIAP